MTSAHRHDRPGRILLITCTLCSMLLGCSAVGPNAIRSGRLAYNEAITETNNQQMLMVLVRNRYEENNHMLAVASVTANVRMGSSAQIEAGFGDSSNYDGNLVPFRGGFVYEENPTISYIPVAGEVYLRQLMSPLPPALFAQVTHSLPYPGYAYTMLLASVNGIRNPSFLFGSQQDDPRFERFVTLMTELTHQHSVYWARASREAASVSLAIEPSTAETAALASELLELLGIPVRIAQGERISVPISLALHGAESGGIGVTTRSIWELVEILTAAVQVPVEDENSGIASQPPRQGRPGRDLRIHYADSEPEHAYVALEHNGRWFYIDSRDRATKRYFKLLSSLWSAAMAESLGASASPPVLTVPVSR
jgi:hypothetical protein